MSVTAFWACMFGLFTILLVVARPSFTLFSLIMASARLIVNSVTPFQAGAIGFLVLLVLAGITGEVGRRKNAWEADNPEAAAGKRGRY